MIKVRKLVLASVGMVGALGFAAQPLVGAAQELPVGYDVAVFSGTANLSGGTCGGVCWVLGSGSYGFGSGSGLVPIPNNGCTGFSDGDPVTPVEAAIPCSITSTGTYSNVVCGTGTIAGTATITEGGPDPSSGSGSYIGVIVASVGVIVVTSGSESDSPGATIVGVSVVQLNAIPSLPTPTPPNFGQCTPNFGITGAFVLTS